MNLSPKLLSCTRDELPDSKAQVKALRSMVGTLLAAENCDAADYDASMAKATQYAAKLFRKPDQCRMVAACSHLFWPPQRVEAVEAPPPPADDDAATVEDAPLPPAPTPKRRAASATRSASSSACSGRSRRPTPA